MTNTIQQLQITETIEPYYMTPDGPVKAEKENTSAVTTSKSFAWKPDIPDHRDYLYTPSATLTAKAKATTKFVIPVGLGNRMEDQGDLGSCTGQATTSALEIVTKSTTQLSRLMAYYGGRALEGTVKTDAGAYVRDVIKALAKSGVCNEELWPYDVTKFADTPPTSAYTDAATIKTLIASYQRVTDLDGIKAALVSGLPVVFGFMVPQYFMNNAVATTGWVRLPKSTDWMIGGHCVVAVGYDDRGANPFVWVRNSWGSGWGRQGYFKMDQKWFTDSRRLVDDMWVIIPK